MSEKKNYKLTPEMIAAIERVVNQGDRAEVIPAKDGIKVLRARREEVKI